METQNKSALEQLRETLFVNMGSATMCWLPKPTGIFDSTSAQQYGNNILDSVDNNIPLAIEILCKELKEDEDYRRSWTANIAMAFKDLWSGEEFQQSEQQFEDVHKLANTAAENFINLLCMDNENNS